MERATDSFNRADNPDLGTAWDKIPNEPTAFRITSQAAVAPYATADAGESNNTVSWHADQWSEVTCPVMSTAFRATGCGVCLRASVSDRTYYRCVVSTDGAEIAKRVSGSYTQLEVDVAPWANNDTLFFSVIGSTLQVVRNGVNLFSTIDAAITTGRPGISFSAVSNPGSKLTNWRGGDDTPDVDAMAVAFVDNQSPDGN